MSPRILGIDLETAPHLAHVWSLWDQNISIGQVENWTEVICFAAKWFGDKRVDFYSVHHHSHEEMIKAAHSLLDEADIVVHYYGKRFDIPHLNREFVELGLNPPSPYRQVDLKQVVAKQFKFASNKLQHVSTKLGLEGKTPHTGFQLWLDCIAGDEKAWRLMKKYNKQDVVLLEELFERIKPWIPGLPSPALYDDSEEDVCNRCGSTDLARQGFAVTQLATYQRYLCKACGGWMRGGKAVKRVDLREVA